MYNAESERLRAAPTAWAAAHRLSSSGRSWPPRDRPHLALAMGLRRGTGAWLGPRPGCSSSFELHLTDVVTSIEGLSAAGHLPERSAIRAAATCGPAST